ncbi:Uncharacterized protein APZ42_002032, partial [Daphnia magna]
SIDCCKSYSAVNSLRLSCGLPKVADITKECRFDFNTTEFVSSVCNASHLATNEEYMCSGYWPGSSSNNSSFIEEDLLCLWYHLRHKTTGTSERNLIESLQEISFDNDRVNLTCWVYINFRFSS